MGGVKKGQNLDHVIFESSLIFFEYLNREWTLVLKVEADKKHPKGLLHLSQMTNACNLTAGQN